MRIVSFIPSLTETLLACGAEVVGRTRYCVHPAGAVDGIPVVGGTKDADWGAVAALGPDLVVLDREENTRSMAAACPCPSLAVHITSVGEAGPELSRLAAAAGLPALEAVAGRWSRAAARPPRPGDLATLPGMIAWWRPPGAQPRVEYLIWRRPWMAVGRGTFIFSMLERMGLADRLTPHLEKYPRIELEELDPAGTVLLFSSEPYPFARGREELLALGFSCGLIDGESYSWYGIRSLRFLEAHL